MILPRFTLIPMNGQHSIKTLYRGSIIMPILELVKIEPQRIEGISAQLGQQVGLYYCY